MTRLLRETLSVRLSADERLLKAGPFSPLGRLPFHRLMKAGRWATLAPGTVLTRQRQPVTHLRAPVGGMASAKVTVTQEARAFEIARADLEHLLHEHEDLRAQFHQALGSELVAKLLAPARPRHAGASVKRA